MGDQRPLDPREITKLIFPTFPSNGFPLAGAAVLFRCRLPLFRRRRVGHRSPALTAASTLHTGCSAAIWVGPTHSVVSHGQQTGRFHAAWLHYRDRLLTGVTDAAILLPWLTPPFDASSLHRRRIGLRGPVGREVSQSLANSATLRFDRAPFQTGRIQSAAFNSRSTVTPSNNARSAVVPPFCAPCSEAASWRGCFSVIAGLLFAHRVSVFSFGILIRVILRHPTIRLMDELRFCKISSMHSSVILLFLPQTVQLTVFYFNATQLYCYIFTSLDL